MLWFLRGIEHIGPEFESVVVVYDRQIVAEVPGKRRDRRFPERIPNSRSGNLI